MRLAPLESILNRNIADSSAARAACQRLNNKTLAINVTAAPSNRLFTLYFTCSEGRMHIVTDEPAAETIRANLFGTPLAYLRMVGPQPEAAMRSGSVRIEGDAEVAQAFRDLLQAAQPDFEEELSRVVGDVAAHQVGKLARGALAFGRQLADTFTQNVSEYLQEESRDVVTRVEVDEFVEAVDTLRDGVERAEARLNRLAAK